MELYQTPINTVAPPGYVHNKYKTVPCKNFLTSKPTKLIFSAGHCKYGDRCTFAHGELDMRAKFVPAELLYPSTTQQSSMDQTQMAQPVYGTVDYSAFSHPPASVVATPYANQEPVQEALNHKNSDYGSDFQLPAFDASQLDEFDQEPFMNAFPGKANGGKKHESMSFPSSLTKESPEDNGKYREMSKFGFGYEALSENLDELELTSSKKELVEKFSQAKYQIEMGNLEEGNQILNEMMENNEIRFKQFFGIDHDILNTFAPISE